MESQLIAHRLTAYALISSIENDLRFHISEKCRQHSISDILPEDVRSHAQERFEKSGLASKGIQTDSDIDLLPYTDFADISKIINKHLESWNEPETNLKQLSLDLISLLPARNNVCHSRPLDPDDFAILYDFSTEIGNKYNEINWHELRQMFNLLKTNPLSVLSFEIPKFWADSEVVIFHNLPTPEFDETGFIGRKEDLIRIKKKILSPHPLATIVGEGGIGKTAITVKCLYDLAFSKDYKGKYDAIIWTTLKTKKLTSMGIVEISNGIKDALGLSSNILSALSTPRETEHLAEQLSTLLEYMSVFKILLVIDNFETLGWEGLREFLSEIPSGSKVLITSRIGLGELEERIPLGPLDPKTAVSLLRRTAEAQGCEFLKKEKEENLKMYAEKLFHNPLLIKWFVNSVAMGKDPITISSSSTSGLEKAIAFCFENLYDKLTQLEKEILLCLVAARKPLTQAQLLFMLDTPPRDDFDYALNRLHHSSILTRSMKTNAVEYFVSPIAIEFVSKFAPPSQALFIKMNSKIIELNRIVQEEEIKSIKYRYDISAVHVTNIDETIAGSYLRKAIRCIQSKEFEEASQLIEHAKVVAPTFSEVYRISGYLNTQKEEYYQATRDYEQAIELNPEQTLPLYNYAYFQYKFLEDYPSARKTCELALNIQPDDVTLQTLHAMLINRTGEWERACLEYENVIKRIDGTDQRWKISTYDQACDAYRRLAEYFIENKNFEKAKQAIMRGIEIAESGIDERLPDIGIQQKYDKLLHECFSLLMKHNDEAFSKQTKARLDYFVSIFGGQILNQPRTQTFLRTYGFQCESNPALLETPSEIRQSYGKIIRLSETKSFGFIENNLGQDIFFHRSEVNFHIRFLTIGQKVKFELGQNHIGTCATNVQISD